MKPLFAILLFVAACSGAEAATEEVATLSGTETETTVAQEVDVEQAFLDFAACLRDHGIDFADPTVDAQGNPRIERPTNIEDLDRETLLAAREDCAPLLAGVTLGRLGVDRTQIEDTLYEYAACMRENEYDLPDPDFSNFGFGGGGGDGEGFSGPFGEIDPDDPAFVTANEVCREVFSGFGFGGGGGPGGRFSPGS